MVGVPEESGAILDRVPAKSLTPEPSRRFPPPWTAEETDACFIIRDVNGQALAYVYFEDERRAAAKPHARRLADTNATASEWPLFTDSRWSIQLMYRLPS